VGRPALIPDGSPAWPTHVVRYGWAEDGLVAVVDGIGVPAGIVAAFVDSLAPAPAAEALPRFERAISDFPPEALVGLAEVVVLSGRFATGVRALGATGHGADMTLSLAGVAAGVPISGGVGSWREGMTGSARFVGDGYLLVAGSVPQHVARVEIELPDGSRLPAVSGRAGGYRMTFFGQWIPVARVPTSYDVLGYDGSGARVLEHQVVL